MILIPPYNVRIPVLPAAAVRPDTARSANALMTAAIMPDVAKYQYLAEDCIAAHMKPSADNCMGYYACEQIETPQ